MRSALFSCLTLWLLAPAAPSMAAEAMRVVAMTYPAWVVRAYESQPLAPGFRLEADDLLRTGEGGRVLLQIPGGAAVKLGESARLLIESGAVGPATATGRLRLLRGAMRLTTGVWSRVVDQSFDVHIGAFHTAIAAADIWGRSADGADLLCLLDGEVAIEVTGEAPRQLLRPAHFLVSLGEGDLSPVRPAARDALAGWLAATELDADAGIARDDGEWQLVLMSLTRLGKAEAALRQLHERGFPVWRKSVIRDGRTLHRLLLPGFESIDAALAAREQVARHLEIRDAWVWKAR